MSSAPAEIEESVQPAVEAEAVSPPPTTPHEGNQLVADPDADVNVNLMFDRYCCWFRLQEHDNDGDSAFGSEDDSWDFPFENIA